MAKLVAIAGGILVDIDNISVIVQTQEGVKVRNTYTLKQDKHLNNVHSTFSNGLDATNELKYIMEAKGVIEPSAALVAEIEKSIEEAKKG